MSKLFNYCEKLFKHFDELFKLLVKFLAFLKASKTQQTSVWTTQPRVLKQILDRAYLLNWIYENVINKKHHIFIEILPDFGIYILPISVEAIPWGTRAVLSQLVTLLTYLIINIWGKKMEKERKELGWVKDFKVENRDKKLC